MKKFFSIIFLGLFLGAVVALLNPHSKQSDAKLRSPSSQNMVGKHQRLFDIQIKAPHGLPKDEKQEVQLNARVTLLQDINAEVHYRWVLPEQVHLLDGEPSDSIVGLKGANTFERSVTLDGLTTEGEPQVVVLQVYAEVGGVNIGSAGVFSTKPSDVQFSEPSPTPGDSSQDKTGAQSVPPPAEKELPRSIQQ